MELIILLNFCIKIQNKKQKIKLILLNLNNKKEKK